MNKNNFIFILLLLCLNGCMADNPHQISPGYIHAMKVLKVIGGGIFALAFMVGIVSMFSDREQLGIVALYAVLIGLFFLIIA